MDERAPAEITATLIERDEVPVLFLRAGDDLEEIRAAWTQLEVLMSSLRGRRFFGTFDLVSGEYRACVQAHADDDPDAFGLESDALPGGSYLRTRLHGEPPEVYDLIAATFTALEAIGRRDETRPSIEFYRRRDEIDLLLPVSGASALR